MIVVPLLLLLLAWISGAFGRFPPAGGTAGTQASADGRSGAHDGTTPKGNGTDGAGTTGNAASAAGSGSAGSTASDSTKHGTAGTAGHDALILDCAMNIQRNDGWIYFINAAWLTRVDEAFTRIEQVVALPDFGMVGTEGSLMSLKSFAVLDEMLYFSLKPNDMESDAAYFRIPLSGGTAEFLFLMPASYMVPCEGRLYLMPKDSGTLAVLDPKQGKAPIVTRAMDVPTTAEAAMPVFAVSDGNLYYLGVEKGGNPHIEANLYRMSLADGRTGKIADHASAAMDRLIGGLVTGNTFVSLHDLMDVFVAVRRTGLDTGASEILRAYGGQVGVVARSGDKLLYPLSETGVYAIAPLDAPGQPEASFMGPEAEDSEIADVILKDLQDAVRRKNDTEGQSEAPAAEVDVGKPYEKIERVCGDYVLTASQIANLATGDRFDYGDIEMGPVAVSGQYDAAMEKAGVLWGEWKGKDTSMGVTGD